MVNFVLKLGNFQQFSFLSRFLGILFVIFRSYWIKKKKGCQLNMGFLEVC